MDSFEIDEQDRKELIEHYSFKLKHLEEKALHYRNLLNKLKGGLAQKADTNIKHQINNVVGNIEGYDISPPDGEKPKAPRQNWKQIALGCLKELNAFSTTQDIYDFLIKKQPVFIQYDKDDIVSKISTALSNLYPKGTIKRIKNTLGRGYFWALPAWYSPELISYYKKKLAAKYGVNEESIFGE
jgi:hypothetical protein